MAPQLGNGLGRLTQRKAQQQSLANAEVGTTKLTSSPAGFTSIFDGSGTDEARDLTHDNEGNIYVAGSYFNPNTSGSDILVRKYSPEGEIIWTQTYAGADNTADDNLAAEQATAVKTNGQNIYAAGYTSSTVSKKDVFIAKYTKDGQQVWKKSFNSPSNDNDVARDLAFDVRGNIYLIGTQTQPKVGSDILIIKYSPSGNLIWNNTFTTTAKSENGLWPGNDTGSSITVSNSQEIYAAGSMDYSTEGQNQRIWLAQLDLNGKSVWEKTLDEGQATSLATDSQNQLIVSGTVFVKEPSGDKYGNALLAKFESGGKETAREVFDTKSSGEENFRDITLDMQGNIYTLGSQTRGGQTQLFARVYNPNLKLKKDRTVEIEGTDRTPRAITVSRNQDTYIAGTTTTGTKPDIFLVKISGF